MAVFVGGTLLLLDSIHMRASCIEFSTAYVTFSEYRVIVGFHLRITIDSFAPNVFWVLFLQFSRGKWQQHGRNGSDTTLRFYCGQRRVAQPPIVQQHQTRRDQRWRYRRHVVLWQGKPLLKIKIKLQLSYLYISIPQFYLFLNLKNIIAWI